MSVGISGKLLHHILLDEISGQLLHVLKLTQSLAVIVGIGEGKLQDESAHGSLFVVAGHVDCVFWHEDIRRDAATAKHLTADARMIGGSRVLDAVLREELAVLVARDDVQFVVLVVARFVGLLNAAS